MILGERQYDGLVYSQLKHTYVRTVDESFDKRLHVLSLISSLQQEHHIHGLLARNCTHMFQINTS